jgi:chemotaxis protein MotA
VANIVFLPLANKIKLKLKHQSAGRAVVISGLVGVAQGDNPRILQEKLECFLPPGQRSKPESH